MVGNRMSARATLRHVDDSEPGIRRERRGKGFIYRQPNGAVVHDAQVLQRIRALAIPPAYRDVWICRSPNGHLQATGRDARGRKQYRYHARWRSRRDAQKFSRIAAFGKVLPALRLRVARDLRLPGLPRDKVLAAVMRLLDRSLIRVGNEEYVRSNRSYGLTTLRTRHVTARGGHLRFDFRGKSGRRQRVSIDDARLAAIVRRCRELPGQLLFQYRDDDGHTQRVRSNDVNAYLRDVAGEEFTARDFRTWGASTQALLAFAADLRRDETAPTAQRTNACIKTVAEHLGNTAAVCRKSYIDPRIVAAYDSERLRGSPRLQSCTRQSSAEQWLRQLLRE
jgi:DNA topoisomerase-1